MSSPVDFRGFAQVNKDKGLDFNSWVEQVPLQAMAKIH